MLAQGAVVPGSLRVDGRVVRVAVHRIVRIVGRVLLREVRVLVRSLHVHVLHVLRRIAAGMSEGAPLEVQRGDEITVGPLVLDMLHVEHIRGLWAGV